MAVPIPFELCVERFTGGTLGQGFADSQTSARGVDRAFGVVESTEPTGARIVRPVASERIVYRIDEAQRERGVSLLPVARARPIRFLAGARTACEASSTTLGYRIARVQRLVAR